MRWELKLSNGNIILGPVYGSVPDLKIIIPKSPAEACYRGSPAGLQKSRLHTCTINHIWQEQHQIREEYADSQRSHNSYEQRRRYFVVSCTEQSMILEQVYNATPTGGVEQPMVTMVIMMMPEVNQRSNSILCDSRNQYGGNDQGDDRCLHEHTKHNQHN